MRHDGRKAKSTKEVLMYSSVAISAALMLTNAMAIKELKRYKDNNLDKLLEVGQAYDDIYYNIDKNDISMGDSLIDSYIKLNKDRYGKYINEVDSKEYIMSLSGEYKGIGLDFGITNDTLYVTRVVKNSPSFEEVKVGDKIKTINKQDTSNKSIEEIKKLLNNSNNIILGIERDNKLIDINVIKSNFIDNGLEYEVKNKDIGYIKISKFNTETNSEFIFAIQELNKKNVTKYIIDLRDNTGGSVDSAIDIIDEILPEGEIVKIETNKGSTKYYSDSNSLGGDIVIITNGNTASAAEMFTQALIDYNKATVIGERTFGKGSELSVVKLRTGGVLVLTSGRYYTKSGVEIEGVGIQPDIEIKETDYVLVKAKEKEDKQLNKAIELLKNK